MYKYLLIVVVFIFALSCNEDSKSIENSTNRGNDPWVFRSVLDKQARIVTLALSDKFWAAYNTNTGGIYKFWKGYVNFQGAVYDNAHGPQPESIGNAFFINKHEQPWQLNVNGNAKSVKAKYLGHHMVGDQVELKYAIQDGGNNIIIKERP
ncbi:MAG: hypothetical protein AAGK97_02450 [Bacteroidota bacterium]